MSCAMISRLSIAVAVLALALDSRGSSGVDGAERVSLLDSREVRQTSPGKTLSLRLSECKAGVTLVESDTDV